MRARHDVRDQFGLRGIRHRWFEHADDGRRARAETNRLAEDRRIALQRGGPEAMREHRRTRRLRSVVLRVQQPAKHRLETHDVEIVAVDDAGTHLARLAEADHREADGREGPDALQRFHALLKILDFRHRKRGVLDPAAARALSDVDQPAFVAVDQWPEQHAAYDAENGGVGANPEREGQGDSEGDALGAGERAQGVFQIEKECHGVSRDSASDVATLQVWGRIPYPTPPP